MKVLFLDVDGVLCLTGTHLEPDLITNLERVVAATGAQVVISSTWRLDADLREELMAALIEHGIHPIGTTPDLKAGDIRARAMEVRLWVEKRQVDEWAVVDDESIPLGGHLVRTDTNQGLTADIAEALIAALGPPDPAVEFEPLETPHDDDSGDVTFEAL